MNKYIILCIIILLAIRIIKNLWIKRKTDSYVLIKRYSKLRHKIRKKNFNDSDPEVKKWLDEADGLNEIIGSLKIITYGDNFQGLDLTDIKLDRAIMQFSNFRNAWLSQTFQVPDYEEYNRTDLLRRWSEGTDEEQKYYQKLWNLCFNFTWCVDPSLLCSVLEEKVRLGIDLSYGDLEKERLKGACLENARLQYARLYMTDLEGAHLESADLQYALLWGSNLRDAHLKNANLQNTNLFGANFENADLENVQLQNAYLHQACFENSCLKGTDLRGARLSNHFTFPDYDRDEDLVNIYDNCSCKEAKKQLKHILVGKGLMRTI